MTRRLAAALVALALLPGCIDDLASPAEVDGPRVLALRVSPEGDPAVAWPAPGETARLEWLAVEPDGRSPALEWSFDVCVADPARVGSDTCAAPPYARVRGGVAAGEAPVTSLDVPASVAAGGSLLLRGVLCTAGDPTADATGLPRGCTAGEEAATAWRLPLDVAARADANRHPDLEGVSLDGEPWTAGAEVGCGGEAPRVEAGTGSLPLELRVAEGALERFVGADGEETTERLQVAHHATAGGFDSYFAFVDEDARTSSVRWTPPAADELEADELTVGFWLVVLDGRGGTAWLSRSVCVTR